MSTNGGAPVSNVQPTPAPQIQPNQPQQQQAKFFHPSRISQRKAQFKGLTRNEKISRLATHSSCKVGVHLL